MSCRILKITIKCLGISSLAIFSAFSALAETSDSLSSIKPPLPSTHIFFASANADSDSDGIINSLDNCPYIANEGQWDRDKDNIGNECDLDVDGDGFANFYEKQQGTGSWDDKSFPSGDDGDGDGLSNKNDNCPLVVNKSQWDSDSDGVGNKCDPDVDGDAFSNEDEKAMGTGVWDPKSFPNSNDNDGIPDAEDNCPGVANPMQGDRDKDGLGNECDPDIDGDSFSNDAEIAAGTKVWDVLSFPAPPEGDRDNDQILDENDNCIDVANKGQWDNDGDNIGNECDPDIDGDGFSNDDEIAQGTKPWDKNSYPGSSSGIEDADKDGVADSDDNCPNVANADQWNKDGDEFGNECDLDIDGDGFSNDDEIAQGTKPWDKDSYPGAGTGINDTDKDGIADSVDNCPNIANTGQWNNDGDTFGDACDDDIDGDGFSNELELAVGTKVYDKNSFPDGSDTDGDGFNDDEDNCPAVSNGGQWDHDLDGIGDDCDGDIDGDGFLNEREILAGTDPKNEHSHPPYDTDNDGVIDSEDQCNNTAFGSAVDNNGCAISHALSLLLEAEDYSNYSDSSAGNEGGEYRNDDVDIEASSDTGGGYNIGYISDGEWLEYYITLAKGRYSISARIASANGGGSYSFSLDGKQVASGTAPSTGDWQSYQTRDAGFFTVEQEGAYTLRFNVIDNGFNLNWFKIESAGDVVENDDDNDGVLNEADLCPNTGLNEAVDSQGCAKVAAKEKILVFSKTAGYHHASIDDGINMLKSIASENNWLIESTIDSSLFNAAKLSEFKVVVWLSTTGDVLDQNQQAAFEDYIENGGGYLGIHAAADTEYDWPWYVDLVGASFKSHPDGTPTAVIDVEDRSHGSTLHLEERWQHTDEWYNYNRNPRAQVEVLMSLDESTYNPGGDAMGDHPIAWYHNVGQGRAFYSGLGHTEAAYNSSTEFKEHITGGLIWAGNLSVNEIEEWTGAPPPNSDFEMVSLANKINEPMAMAISTAGDLFVVGRQGEFYALENGSLNVKSMVPTNTFAEGGLIGIALDPNFVNNRHVFLHYVHPTEQLQVISRFTLNLDNSLDFASESVLLTLGIQMTSCCHTGGAMAFDNAGNLFITTGDNTNPHGSGGYAPIDERGGRSDNDAQKSASNTNDLRGKILRITPTADGSYTIPAGNLFPADSQHRGEIYTMGHRNPFRIAIDPRNDRLFWGDIGPDAGPSDPNRGPGGYDEINRTSTPGNFGWPYFSGNNEAYNEVDFASGHSGAKYDPNNVINNSPNNTGAQHLPNAQPSWITMGHRATMLADVYRWDPNIKDEYKLPSYFEGRLIYWNFNNDQMFETHTEEDKPALRQWLDTSMLDGIIDGVISPHNNRLYLIAYGGNCCGSPPYSGVLAEVRYTGAGSPSNGSNGVSGPEDISANLYAVNAGGDEYEVSDGTVYQGENYSSAGFSVGGQNAIADTNDDYIYQTHKWYTETISYNFPIENGRYEVLLQFAETYFNQAGQRSFHIDMEDRRVLNDVDVAGAVGPDRAYNIKVSATVEDGELNIDFIPSVENPMISGIVILPEDKGDIADGSVFSFKAGANGLYVSASNSSLIANSDTVNSNELFEVVHTSGKEGIALKSIGNGNYVSVDSAGLLSASATSVGESELFQLFDGDNGIALKSLANGKFVSADNAGSSALVANRAGFGSWELFDLAIADICQPKPGYGIDCRPHAPAYQNMPQIAEKDLSNVPRLLSQTGLFSNLVNMEASEGLIPYDLIAPLWSDRAVKSRWVSVPSGETIIFAESGRWVWPAGTVLIKTFSLPTDEDNPTSLQRLETRVNVVQPDGSLYSVTYKWRADNSDADLLTSLVNEDILIKSSDGNWIQTWTYPGPKDCVSCHNEDIRGTIGPKTASLNRDYTYSSNVTDNQIRTWNNLGLFSTPVDESRIANMPQHANIKDTSKSLEHRVRSYWDMNCGSCHGPLGIASKWDGRYETPLSEQGVVNGELANQRDYLHDYGLSSPKVVDPGNPENSILYIRDGSEDSDDAMPPLGRALADDEYMEVLKQWINSL